MSVSLNPVVLPPGDGQVFPGPGDSFTAKLTANATGDRFSLGEYSFEPGCGPPLHRHEREDELFWILDGDVKFHVDGVEYEASAGACVFAPRGTKHTFKNCGNRRARMLVMVTPGRNFEDFYSEFVKLITGSLAEEAAMAQVVALGERHGIEFFGPNPL